MFTCDCVRVNLSKPLDELDVIAFIPIFDQRNIVQAIEAIEESLNVRVVSFRYIAVRYPESVDRNLEDDLNPEYGGQSLEDDVDLETLKTIDSLSPSEISDLTEGDKILIKIRI